MRTIAKLIKKEKLINYYKLSFVKSDKNFFLTLHRTQQKIFNWLKINRVYSCWYEQGFKYSFLKKVNLAEQKSTAEKIFLTSLLKKTTSSTSQIQRSQKSILFLFKKYEEYLNLPFILLSKKEQKEIQILNELKTLFLIDYIAFR